MNPDSEKELQFKDKEINAALSSIKKVGERQFGETFKSTVMKQAAVAAGPEAPPGPAPKNLSATPLEDKTLETIKADHESEAKRELYSIVKPLRTYERDMAETIRAKNESVASINIASQRQREERGEHREPRAEPKPILSSDSLLARKGLFALLSVILLLAAAGIGGLVYYYFASRPTPVAPAAPALISTNETRVLDVTGKNSGAVFATVLAEINKPETADNGPVGNIVRLELTEKVTDQNGALVTQEISPEKYFEVFAAGAPPSLGRAFGASIVFGFHNASTGSEPFLLTSVASSDSAYDGMIRWESAMAKDLGPVFIKVAAENSTTASTTLPSLGPAIKDKFEDAVIKSKDVRELKDISGNIVLLYSFIDPKDLIITTNEETFKEILNRFFASQIVR